MLRLPSFTYLQPKTLTEALAMKTEAGPAGSYVAGGTDLYPNMKRRQQEPRTVISLMKIPELRRSDSRTVGQSDGDIVLGASLTLTELSDSPTVRQSVEVVSRAAELVSTPLLRNMGTLGGNLCLDTRCNYYDQTYEWRKAIDFCMKMMVALGAEFLLVGPKGERVVPAARLYANDGIDYLTKQPDEILALVRLPAADGWDAVYHKLRRRGSFDFPVLGVAVWLRWDARRVAAARVVLGGVASLPQEVPEAGAVLTGSDLSDEVIRAAAEAAYRPAKPLDNTDFDLSWRKQMTRVYVKAALGELRARRP